MPAHELESRIIERVQEFLRADAEIFERLSVTAESPASLHSLVSAAKKLAAKLGAAPSNDLRVLLEPFLQSVIVQENNIQVVLSATHMRELLESGGQISTSKWTDVQEAANPSESICLTIETKRKRYGGEIHLVVPPKLGLTVQHPRPALIKAVARGHVWSKRILEGKVDGLKSLACEAGLTPQYVRGVLSCAFLAPDIVEAILEGRQPLTLKFANLYKHIPLSWAEQRRKFGFLPEPTSVQSLPG